MFPNAIEVSNFVYYFFVLFDPNLGVLLHRTRAVPLLKIHKMLHQSAKQKTFEWLRRGENQYSLPPAAENAPLSSDVVHLRNVTQNGKMVSGELLC